MSMARGPGLARQDRVRLRHIAGQGRLAEGATVTNANDASWIAAPIAHGRYRLAIKQGSRTF